MRQNFQSLSSINPRRTWEKFSFETTKDEHVESRKAEVASMFLHMKQKLINVLNYRKNQCECTRVSED